MMRGPRYYAVAVRRLNGEIVVQHENIESLLRRFQWLNKPFLRGTLALIDALVLGMKSLMFSADIAMRDAEEATPKKPRSGGNNCLLLMFLLPLGIFAWSSEASPESPTDGKPNRAKSSINDIAISATMVLGLALGIVIFVVLPHLLVGLLQKPIGNSFLLNLAEGFTRLALFVLYVLAISLMKDIRRVFEYHGAEHKVINTFEAGQELTFENINKYGTIHQRCGTSFILLLIVLSIFLFAFLGWHNAWYLRVGSRLLLLPVLAGLAYEGIRFAGKHRDSVLVNAILSPGLLLQKITTRQPDDKQIEVAVKSLEAVIGLEQEQEVSA